MQRSTKPKSRKGHGFLFVSSKKKEAKRDNSFDEEWDFGDDATAPADCELQTFQERSTLDHKLTDDHFLLVNKDQDDGLEPSELSVVPVTNLNPHDELGIGDFNALFSELKQSVYLEHKAKFTRRPGFAQQWQKFQSEHKDADQDQFIQQHAGFKQFFEKGKLFFKEHEDDMQFELDYFALTRNFHPSTPSKTDPVSRRIIFLNLVKDADTQKNEEGLTSLSTLINGLNYGEKVKKPKKPKKIKLALNDEMTDKVVIENYNKKIDEENEAIDEHNKMVDEFNRSIDFLIKEKKNGSIILFPIRQCRGFVRNCNPKTGLPFVKAAHIVLGIFDTKNNHFETHDSQSGMEIPYMGSMATLFYPNKADELRRVSNQETMYHGTQKHSHMCGYFVFNWLALLANTGWVNSFKYLHLTPTDIQSKPRFLKHWMKVTNKSMETCLDYKIEDNANRAQCIAKAEIKSSQGDKLSDKEISLIAEYARSNGRP